MRSGESARICSSEMAETLSCATLFHIGARLLVQGVELKFFLFSELQRETGTNGKSIKYRKCSLYFINVALIQ